MTEESQNLIEQDGPVASIESGEVTMDAILGAKRRLYEDNYHADRLLMVPSEAEMHYTQIYGMDVEWTTSSNIEPWGAVVMDSDAIGHWPSDSLVNLHDWR